ncbi:MAG: HRDC domain-containing protein [Planctomycetaceae bacterium]
MQIQFFQVPVHASQVDELNRFLGTHRVTSIERQFVSDGANSFWSICVTYEKGDPPQNSTQQKERIDYRDLLSEKQFRIYSKLRVLRKDLSERDKVPAYSVFNNEHLAEVVRRHVTTREELAKIAGVGQSRIERYADPFLEMMRAEKRPESGGSDGTPAVGDHAANAV